MPFFTVIIPLFNKEKYVENALKSILNQTFTDYEILIVNDCCTDKSIEKITPFLSEKIKLIHHKTNKGLSATRNTGIKNATANYITFLDADDLWKPKFLETIYSLITDFPEAKIFATNYEEIYGSKVYNPLNGSESLPKDFLGYLNFFKINLKQGIYNHGCVCFAKEVYNKVGLYNETINFSEDLDFNIRANYYFKLAYNNSVEMSYFMQTDNQLTRSSIKEKSIPDYDIYEDWTKNNTDLKKYLDFERYVLGKKLKNNGDFRWKKMVAKIDNSNLSYKQNILLKLPKIALISIEKIKLVLLRFGIKIATY